MRLKYFLIAISLILSGVAVGAPAFAKQSGASKCEASCQDKCKNTGDQCRRNIDAMSGFCRVTGNGLICKAGKKKGCEAQQDYCNSMCFVDFGDAGPKCEPEPSPPPVEPKDTGSSKGDPHITTYDGLRFLFHAAGDFLLTESLDDEVAVHIRQVPVYNVASVNSAIGIRIGALHFQYDSRDQVWTVTQGGTAISLDDFSAGPIDGVDIALQERQGLIIAKPGTVSIRVHLPKNGRVEPYIQFLGNQETRGVLGNRDGDPQNDLAQPEDTGREWRSTVFADLWRLIDATSLLPYREGETVETFTVKPHPSRKPKLSNTALAYAASACVAANVPNTEMGMCIYDVAITEDASWAEDILNTNRTEIIYAREDDEGVPEKLFGRFLAGTLTEPIEDAEAAEGPLAPTPLELLWPQYAISNYEAEWATKFPVDCAEKTENSALCECQAGVLTDPARTETNAQKSRIAYLLTAREFSSRSEAMEAMRAYAEEVENLTSTVEANAFIIDDYRLYLAVNDSCKAN